MLSDLPCTDRVWRAGRAVPRDWPASESSLRGGTREPSTTSVRCVDVLAASSPGRCGHLETHTTPSAGHHAELSDSCGDSPEQLDSRRWGRRAGGRPPGRQSRATASAELPAPARTCAPGGQRPPVISATVLLHRGEAQAGAVCTCPRFEMEPRGRLTGESARDFLKKRKQKPDTLRGQKGRGSSEPSLEMATADPSTLKLTPQEMQDL